MGNPYVFVLCSWLRPSPLFPAPLQRNPLPNPSSRLPQLPGQLRDCLPATCRIRCLRPPPSRRLSPRRRPTLQRPGPNRKPVRLPGSMYPLQRTSPPGRPRSPAPRPSPPRNRRRHLFLGQFRLLPFLRHQDRWGRRLLDRLQQLQPRAEPGRLFPILECGRQPRLRGEDRQLPGLLDL